MKLKFSFRLTPTLILLILCLTETLIANYTFLGNITSVERITSGIKVLCEGNQQLLIDFYHPEMYRVTLLRSEYSEPLLSYPIDKTNWDPVELEFQETDSVYTLISESLELIIQKQPCRITVKNKTGYIINQDDPGFGIGWDGKEVRNWKTIAEDEKFFGLGEKTGNLDKRGVEWVMWNTDNPFHNNGSDPIYQSIPFFIGMRNYNAYGIYFNNSYRTRFNLGAGNSRYYSFSAEGGSLDYFFIFGPEVSKVVETYSELTGRTPLPPKWSLGYQQCRWSYFPDTEVLRLANTFREKQIPADVIYLDIHYMDGYRVFTWDDQRFPDPVGLIQKLKELGFKITVIIDPGIKVDADYWVAQEGLAEDHFVKYPDGEMYVGYVWPDPSYFPDFSQRKTQIWWGSLFAGLLDVGVQGFWTDMNEPAVWGQAFPDEVLFNDMGHISSHKKMHNLYGFLMAKSTYEGVMKLRPKQRPFVITRAGFAGEQRFTSVWTGDNAATEEHLEMGIRMLQGLGISGVPFVGTDVGGFGGTPSPELYARWIQFGTFSPFFRSHTHYGSSDQEPWSFGETVEDISRKFISKRYEILPYIYSLFYESSQTGAPLIRPMFWHDQDDFTVYDTAFQLQFYLGAKYLIAPVTRDGVRMKKIYLPEGKWLDVNSEKSYQGPTEIVVDTPLDLIPAFFREGAIIPSREVNQYVGEKPLTILFIDIFPATDKGIFQLYEDDGQSFDYQKGTYRLTHLEFRTMSNKLIFTKTRVHDQYNPGERSLELRFHATESPRRIKLGNKELQPIGKKNGNHGFTYNKEKKILTIDIPDAGKLQQLTIW